MFSMAHARKLLVLLAVASVSIFWCSWLFFVLTADTSSAAHAPAKPLSKQPESPTAHTESLKLLESPQNATLGFQKIAYINLDTRYDLDDALVLQSSLSGLRIDRFSAVDATTLTDKGLPPASTDWYTKKSRGVLACYRSHANLWRKMLEERWETLLIFEADVAWDANIKPIMAHFANGLAGAMLSVSAHNGTARTAPHGTAADYVPTERDPYMSKHWELLQFGGCWEKPMRKEFKHEYPDPYAPLGIKYVDDTPITDGSRVVRWQNEMMCTTAYAVTREGAKKLLLRAALDMNTEVDGLVSELVREDKITAYTAYPNIFVQWEYVNNLGSDNKNSDITVVKEQEASDETRKAAWKLAREKMKVWKYNGMFGKSSFRDGLLFRMKEKLYGKTDL